MQMSLRDKISKWQVEGQHKKMQDRKMMAYGNCVFRSTIAKYYDTTQKQEYIDNSKQEKAKLKQQKKKMHVLI